MHFASQSSRRDDTKLVGFAMNLRVEIIWGLWSKVQGFGVFRISDFRFRV